MGTEIHRSDLEYLRTNLAEPDNYSLCIHPGIVQRMVKQISHGALDIKTIDTKGNDTLHAIPPCFIDDVLHSFYEIHYNGVSLGRIRLLDDHIQEPAAMKHALERVIDEYLQMHTMNGHIISIDFFTDKDHNYHHQLSALPFPADLFGKVLYQC